MHRLDAKGCKGPNYNDILYRDTYKFAELEKIVFEDSTIFDGGYLITSSTGPWNGFANLRILNLNNVGNLNDVRLQSLKDTLTLVRLSVKGTQVTEAGVKQLSQSLPFCTIEWDGGVIQGKKRLRTTRRRAINELTGTSETVEVLNWLSNLLRSDRAIFLNRLTGTLGPYC